MSSVLLFLIFWLGSTFLYATEVPQQAFVGCFNRLPNGSLQFGALPSGKQFLLRGPTSVIEEHINQLVRVRGESVQNGNGNGALQTLVVDKVQVLAESCTSALPTKEIEGVPGKVGEDIVAVPLTTTSTEDQTTPGFQTQAATYESPGSLRDSYSQAAESADAPLHPEQAGQSEAAANVNAGAVERTEILPGSSLGVNRPTGSAEALPPGAESATASASESSSKPVTVTISGDENPKLSPPALTVRIGQTVEWRNASTKMQEIIANPARGKQPSTAALPTGAAPFDSGFLRPDHSFQYRFTVRGVYRYICKLNNVENSPQVEGQIVVGR